MKWGLLGGTFDPVHLGHLRCAEEIRELFGLEKIIFVPAAGPPFKRSKITSFADRLKMVEQAIRGNPCFEASGVEGRRQGISYSIDTVRHFRETQGPGMELFFILGQDAFRDIAQWKEWEELLSLCHLVVMTRLGYEGQGLEGVLPSAAVARFTPDPGRRAFRGPGGTSIFFRSVTFLDISSTEIRKRLAGGKSVRYLIPPGVVDYISRHSLYVQSP